MAIIFNPVRIAADPSGISEKLGIREQAKRKLSGGEAQRAIATANVVERCGWVDSLSNPVPVLAEL